MIKYIRAGSGNTATITALVFPIVLLLCGAGVDLVQYTIQKSELQNSADAAALAGAKALSLATTDSTSIEAFVKSELEFLVKNTKNTGEFSSDAKVSIKEGIVETTVKQETNPYFLGKFLKNAIVVESQAVAAGSVKLCALALNENTGGAISLNGEARIEADECSVFSNSSAPGGINLQSQAFIDADVICSSGGFVGNGNNYTNEPIVDCPVYPDPLADALMKPTIGACDETQFNAGSTDRGGVEAKIKDIEMFNSAAEALQDPINQNINAVTLSPGVYCGGLRVNTFAQATFEPGLYIIQDGPLVFDRDSVSAGENITFYLTGTNSRLFMEIDAAVDLTAAKTGNLAGILFMEDPDQTTDSQHAIRSGLARTLLGTFYLPNSTFSVETFDPIADQSAYTIIVANRIRLENRPSLVLNSNYSASDIPVPNGVGPIGGTTYLRK